MPAEPFAPPQSRPLPRYLRAGLWAQDRCGPALRMALEGVAGIRLRWDSVRDALGDAENFRPPYAQVEDRIVGGPSLSVMGAEGERHRVLRARLECALGGTDDFAAMAGRARASVEAGLAPPGAAQLVDAAPLFHAATMAALRPWLGLDGAEVADATLAQWAMTLFEWQVSGAQGRQEQVAQEMAAEFRHCVEKHIHIRQASGGWPSASVPARLHAIGCTPEEQRATVIALAVGGFPQLPIAAMRALNQLLWRREALEAARGLATARPRALWPYLREALRFDPVAAALRRRTFAAPGAAAPRATTDADGTVVLVLASAMRDGRRVPRPERFDPARDSSAHLHFGRGPHACPAQSLVATVLPAMVAPILARGGLAQAAGMRGAGLCPDSLLLRFTT